MFSYTKCSSWLEVDRFSGLADGSASIGRFEISSHRHPLMVEEHWSIVLCLDLCSVGPSLCSCVTGELGSRRAPQPHKRTACGHVCERRCVEQHARLQQLEQWSRLTSSLTFIHLSASAACGLYVNLFPLASFTPLCTQCTPLLS